MQDGRRSEALDNALAVAIAARKLPRTARKWGKTVQLEELAPAMGLARHTLRNLYYRDDGRFEATLNSYVSTSQQHVIEALRASAFHEFAPIVWKREPAQLQASWQALSSLVTLVRAAEQTLRQCEEPPLELRHEIGAAAAEIMACSLTFLDGGARWRLLQLGERIFLSAMAPLAFAHDIGKASAALFARFWENRATRCGQEWSNVWDDPALPPPVDPEVIEVALGELEHAAGWTLRRCDPADGDESERLRQLLADKAKWLAKGGRFAEAKELLAQVSGIQSRAARADALLIETLEAIADNRLAEAAASAALLEELTCDADESSIAAATAAIMVHNIALLRGQRPPLPERAQQFLRQSPVVASEMVSLPRYKGRLDALGYARPSAPQRDPVS